MNEKRALEILKNCKISEVFYKNDPIWIQEIDNKTAKIGFLNGSSTNVLIEDLYE